jgi:hypothetical protein
MRMKAASAQFCASVLLAQMGVPGVARGLGVSGPPVSASHSHAAATGEQTPVPVHLTVVNMSGKRRQLILGKTALDLPVGQSVGLRCSTGDFFIVVSDTDSRVMLRHKITQSDATRILPIR